MSARSLWQRTVCLFKGHLWDTQRPDGSVFQVDTCWRCPATRGESLWQRVDRRAVAERDCPTCGVPKGSKCRDVGPFIRLQPHDARVTPIYREELRRP